MWINRQIDKELYIKKNLSTSSLIRGWELEIIKGDRYETSDGIVWDRFMIKYRTDLICILRLSVEVDKQIFSKAIQFNVITLCG